MSRPIQLWDHEMHLKRLSRKYGAISYGNGIENSCAKRKELYKNGDKVMTPRGKGRVDFIEDGIVCVEFKEHPGALYEFELNEVYFSKKSKRKKRKNA